jgi:pimeloyl-ACP methyl ester carboxylesterase
VLVHEQLNSEPSRLDLWIASTATRPVVDHVLILVHGLPRTYGMGRQAAGLLPELAEHLANESGWLVASGTMSGIGASTGTFSVAQWRRDLDCIIERLSATNPRVSLAGFGLGGAVALAAAYSDDRVRGVATFAAPANLARWCGDPTELHNIVTTANVVDPNVALLSPDELVNDILSLDSLGAAASVPPKRFLIGHGADDREVPVAEARDLLAAAEGRAELRVIQGAGHWLRADPRMVATLLGWLDRHR